MGAPLSVSFQGERGAFSEDAVHGLLEPPVDAVPRETFEEVFEVVARGQADACVVPIENTLAGSVLVNYDLLVEHELEIVGELTLRIVHHLIAPPGVDRSALRKVFSHPVALAQCAVYFREHPELEPIAAYDTAGSVKMVMERRRGDEAAIAGASAAERHGAEIVASGLESHVQNFTRFLLLARPDRSEPLRLADPSPDRKTTIVFRLASRPGALFRALAPFSLREIDMTKIESRPIVGRPWEYSFTLDFLGDRTDPRVAKTLDFLGELVETVRILGSYPRARPPAVAGG